MLIRIFIVCLAVALTASAIVKRGGKEDSITNIEESLNDPLLVDSVSNDIQKYQAFLESVRKATSVKNSQQKSDAAKSAELGFRALGEAVRDPLLLSKALADLEKPEVLSEVAALMNDPDFKQELKMMMESPKFKAAMTRASADFESLTANPEMLTSLREALNSNQNNREV